MKKLGKILFAFMFMFVGILSAKAADLGFTLKYLNKAYALNQVGSSDKVSISVVDTPGELFENAAKAYYPETSWDTSVPKSDRYVTVTPFVISVSAGQTFGGTDTFTLNLNLPTEFGSDDSSIYLAKIDPSTQHFSAVYSINTADANNTLTIGTTPIDGLIVTTQEGTPSNYFSNKYLTFTGNDINSTGETYYALITCKGVALPTVDVPTTTTTTIDNPQTGEQSSTLYIALGVIGLIGILGLGTKFAKANK